MSKLAMNRHGRQAVTTNLTIPAVPSPTLFKDMAGRFADIVSKVGTLIDSELQAAVTPAMRASHLTQELVTVQRFGPVTTPYGPKEARTVSVRVEYRRHQKPNRHHSAAERQEILQASEAARKHERTYQLVSRAPVAEWTIDELVRVVDDVRRRLPRGPIEPANWVQPGCVALTEDRYKDDGRRLVTIQVSTTGSRAEQRYHVWFLTQAGYAAVLQLPAMVPAAVLTGLATGADRYANVTIELNKRAVAAVAKAQARTAELAAVANRKAGAK